MGDTPTALQNLTGVFSQIFTWITDAFDTITGEPILLLGLGLMVASAIIGLTYKLIRG